MQLVSYEETWSLDLLAATCQCLTIRSRGSRPWPSVGIRVTAFINGLMKVLRRVSSIGSYYVQFPTRNCEGDTDAERRAFDDEVREHSRDFLRRWQHSYFGAAGTFFVPRSHGTCLELLETDF
jgi:hypothetical protein